ncbi:hypothetical protein [Chryseobacterium balustinum]|uniref:hypothetical protein n=1 Tax=Chryseobacterium balustinum TaxID=246 RepID=UPI003CEE51CE
MKFTEKIIQSINLANSTYLDSDGATQSFQPLEIYLVPKGEGDTTHERYVVDNSGIISKGAGGGNFIPMEGIPADKFMQNTFVIGNKTASAMLGNYDYRTVIDDKILYNYGDINKMPYQNSTGFAVNANGLFFVKRKVNFAAIPQGSTIQADDYASIISFRGLNNYDNEVRVGEIDSHMSSKKIVVNNYYTTTISTRAAEQDVLIKIETPTGDNAEFTFDKDSGITSDIDFSGVSNPLSFAQQKYVDSKSLKDSIVFDLPSRITGGASYRTFENYAIVDFDLQVDTAGGLKILTTENSHGFGAFNKLVTVETKSGGEVRYIRIKGSGNGQGLFIGKAFDSDDDFEFYLKEVMVTPFAGAVVDP